MITRLANCALKLAEAGFRVFPAYGIVDGKCECGNPNCDAPGKHPAIKGWKQKATSDKEQIMTWWKRCGNHNPAIATGKGLVVLDVDGETGKESLRKLEEEYIKALARADKLQDYDELYEIVLKLILRSFVDLNLRQQ